MSYRAGDLDPDTEVFVTAEVADMSALYNWYLDRSVRLLAAGVEAGLITSEDCAMARAAIDSGQTIGEVLDYFAAIVNRVLDFDAP